MAEASRRKIDFASLTGMFTPKATVEDNLATAEQFLDTVSPAMLKLTALTAEGGPLDMGNKLRQIALLLGDGTFLVSSSHRMDPLVQTLQSRAQHLGYLIGPPTLVGLDEIAARYRKSGLDAPAAPKKIKIDETEIYDTTMKRDFLAIIEELAAKDCSDLRVKVERNKTKVRIRLDGIMRDYKEWSSEYGHQFCSAVHHYAAIKDTSYQFNDYQSALVISKPDLSLPGGIQGLRVEYSPLIYNGRLMVVRFLYERIDGATDIAGLGFTPEHQAEFNILRSKRKGLIVVAGPTGSGKSTTLYRNSTLISIESNFELTVIEIADPPENLNPNADQMPVTNSPTTAMRAEAYQKALNSSLRSDPDVIINQEIRDLATTETCIQAALTGHVVWTTLHANSAIATIDRLRDLGVELWKLTDHTLIVGLISQRLLPKLCQGCALSLAQTDIETTHPDLAGRLQRLAALFAQTRPGCIDLNKIRFRGKGCARCRTKIPGYHGRTVAAEIIRPDHAFMRLYQDNDRLAAQDHWIRELRGQPIIQHAIALIAAGSVDPRDVESTIEPLDTPLATSKACIENTHEAISEFLEQAKIA